MQQTTEVVAGNGAAVFAKWALGGITGLWLGFSPSLQSLIIFMGLDYLTGLACASLAGTLSSREGFRGIARKSMTLLIVGTAYYVQRAYHIGVDLGAVVAMAFSANELVSIVENCAHAGVPIPEALLAAVLKAKRLAGPTRTAEQIEREIAEAEKEDGK